MSLSARSLPSLLSAILLYLSQHAFNLLAVAVIPWLIALGETSPRAAALGWLGLLTSPVPAVALAHRFSHGVLDLFDRTARAPSTTATSPAVASLWAGLFAWFAMTFSSLASALLMLAIFPPPADGRALAALIREFEDPRLALGAHAVLWVGVAAFLYYVERRVLQRAS